MKLYTAFLKDLDSNGKGTSGQLSEIDLSDPEDVKALVPDHNSEILVHFGTENFLSRFQKFQEHLVEWRTQYPRLSGVDMRYERQVVLQMPPKDSTVTPSAATADIHPGAFTATASHPAGSTPRSASGTRTPETKHLAVARPAGGKSALANDAARKKRVEAIKLWMAKREKARAAGQTR